MEKDEIAARLSRIEMLLKGMTKRLDSIDELIHDLATNMAPMGRIEGESRDHSK
jgi:hypothetical protein